MTRQSGHVAIKTSDIRVTHAIETLSKIAELGFEEQSLLPTWDGEAASATPLAAAHSAISHPAISHPILAGAIGWLHQQNSEKLLKIAQEDFKVILDYLKKFDKLGEGVLVDPKTLEGMKSIMLLVVEAADKLDGYLTRQVGQQKIEEQKVHLFQETASKSVKESREFKELLQYYKSKIAPIASNEEIVKRVFELPIGEILQASLGKGTKGPLTVEHHVVDLELVRKDQEYELLFLRKEDGSRFFHPKLLRSLKLMCHFEESSFLPKQAEFFRDIALWDEAHLRLLVKSWVQATREPVNSFLQKAKDHIDIHPVSIAYKMIYALLLANASGRVFTLEVVKGVKEYLHDFHFFLSQLVRIPEVVHMCHTRSWSKGSWQEAVVHLIDEVVTAIYLHGRLSRDLGSFIGSFLHSAKIKEYEISLDKERTFSQRLLDRYLRLEHACREFSSEPISKTLQLMEEVDAFDPFLFSNYPFKAFDLSSRFTSVPILRLPFPTHQECVNHAPIQEEYKDFLLSWKAKNPGKKILLVNLQDSSSWKEESRCRAIQELVERPEFQDVVSLLSLNRGCDLYMRPTHAKNMVDSLEEITHLSSNLKTQINPKEWGGQLFSRAADATITEYVELYHAGLLLEATFALKPSALFVMCKDGLDSTLSFLGALFILLKSFRGRKVAEAEEQYLDLLLFGPTLLQRRRALHTERFMRLIRFIRFLEEMQQVDGDVEKDSLMGRGHFDELFPKDILDFTCVVPSMS